eukprot:363292-Chlamydomonas_euryale.AAC.9
MHACQHCGDLLPYCKGGRSGVNPAYTDAIAESAQDILLSSLLSVDYREQTLGQAFQYLALASTTWHLDGPAARRAASAQRHLMLAVFMPTANNVWQLA